MPSRRNTNQLRHQQRRRIESNDAALTDLRVGSDDFLPPDGDWRRDGEAVGGNTRLESLEVFLYEEDDADEGAKNGVGAFFRGVAKNRSIAELSLCDCGAAFVGPILEALPPFFQENAKLRVLDVSGAGAREIASLAASLEANASLDSLAVRSPNYEGGDVDGALEALCEALAAHPSLMVLHLSGFRFGRAGGNALLPLLESPNPNSLELFLECENIDDDGLAVMSWGLRDCTRLRKLTLQASEVAMGLRFSTEGWQSFAACLDGPICELEELVFRGANLHDAAVAALAGALGNNTHLKSLDISYHQLISISGWRSLAALLRNPLCRLEALFLRSCAVDNERTLALTESLNSNTSLKRLSLDGAIILASGWQALAGLLSNPRSNLECLSLASCGISRGEASDLARAFSDCRLKSLRLSYNHGALPHGLRPILNDLSRPHSLLEELHLDHCAMTDDAVMELANSLNTNNKLRVLRLGFNPGITIAVWRIIAASLRNPHSALETLSLQNNRIQDDVAIMFADSLARNSKLKELNLDYNQYITKAAWDVFSRAMCDPTSIMSTYNSNHTLHALHPYPTVWHCIGSNEKINSNPDKSHVARQKIIQNHFANGTSIEPFLGMELKLLPRAVAWMAREADVNDGGKSMLFLFLPSLLECVLGPVPDSKVCD